MSEPTGGRRLEQLLAAKEIVICCGPGGVGKTTTAAALATGAAAIEAAKILVVTVDPARRLADALGVGELGDEPRPVPTTAFASAKVTPKGELWAAMLDARRSWDGLVARLAPDVSTASEILANPLYRNLTRRFARSHDYIAMERLYELHAEGSFDLIVVDTPPTRNALDLLDAPARMREFFSSGLLRWLVAPTRSRLVNLASRPFYQVADRILGTELLADLARFFLLFQTMQDGFTERAAAVNKLIGGPMTTFVVVTTLEVAPVAEAGRFTQALQARHLHLGLLVANKMLPESLRADAGAAVAEAMTGRAGTIAAELAGAMPKSFSDPARLQGVLEEVGRNFLDFRLVANREAELFDELAAGHDLGARVPHLAGEITDVPGLLAVAEHLFGRKFARARQARAPSGRPIP